MKAQLYGFQLAQAERSDSIVDGVHFVAGPKKDMKTRGSALCAHKICYPDGVVQ